MSKSRSRKANEKGILLESRVARWLESQFGYKCKAREFVRGKAVKRPYEVDVHGQKRIDFYGTIHIWVESKAQRIKRSHVAKLVVSAREVRDAAMHGVEKWYPKMLMLVSDAKGFDTDAIGLANKYRIYCVKAGSSAFKFIGEMSREHFKGKEYSDY